MTRTGWAAVVVCVASAFDVMHQSAANAQQFPAACTARLGYSASCCKASYAAQPDGAIPPGARLSDLEQCKRKEVSRKSKAGAVKP
jgi:hypothetical protein